MATRWGPGPVFVYESITALRRWQHYALRSLAVLALLAGLAMVWMSVGREIRKALDGGSIHEIAAVGRSFFYAIATVQISLVLLAAPAATAGAVCLDRARGTLTHMLLTDLSDSEIVLGKLLARLAPVVALVAASVPVLAICTLLGGVAPDLVVVLTLVSLALAVFGCSLALAVSVRATKTHEVLMAVYTVWVIAILGPLIWWVLAQTSGVLPKLPDWVFLLDPYYLVCFHAGSVEAEVLAPILGGMLAVSAVLIVYAIKRLRAEVSGRNRRAGPVRASWGPAPSLDGNPVLWREWQRARPSRLARAVWGLFIVSSILGTGWGIGATVWMGIDEGAELIVIVNCFEVGLGLLLVSITASTALAEERVRGGLDVLLASPLSTFSIVIGKWWAMFRLVPRLAILPAVGAFMLAATSLEERSRFIGPLGTSPVSTLDRVLAVVFPVASILAQGAAITSLGLALATWISRVGRAVAVSVSLYVAITIGGLFLLGASDLIEWVIAGLFGYKRPGNERIIELLAGTLYLLNPIYTQVEPTLSLYGASELRRGDRIIAQSLAIALTLAFAASLFGLTLLTFGRCLGRSPERPRRAPKPPRSVVRAEARPEPDLGASQT